MDADTADPPRSSGRETLAGLAAAVRSGEVSSTRLVRESLRRIDANRDLNAVVARRDERALADADHIDDRVRMGQDPGQLAGLPVLVKDNEDSIGLPTTFGSHLFKDAAPAMADGVVAARLRAAGAVVVGKTNLPEFALEGYTDNPMFGPTVNPWDRAASPGGSSGGSAAALAAGLVPLATATDVGGSVRIPAALCGLVGLKPTAGLFDLDSSLVAPELNSHGPLAPTVRDARLVLAILTGPIPGRVISTRPTRLIASPRLADGPALSGPVDAAFLEAVETLHAVVGGVLEAATPDRIFPGGYETEDWFRIVGVEQAHALGRDVIERDASMMDPVVAEFMRLAIGIPFDEHIGARRRSQRYRLELDRLLGDDGVLVTPTLAVDGWSADGRLPGRERPGLPSWVFNTEPPNLTGHPAISVPAGRLPGGLPFGLQIIGPRASDQVLLDLAGALEEAAPWPMVAPGFEPYTLGSILAAEPR
jgi:Asp-tRNA(Asn)/Glu-tRNA(Gln) amidotransferase A subunit family amidase